MSTYEVDHDTRLLELYRDHANAEQTLRWKTAQYRSESLGRTDRRQFGKDARTLDQVAADMQARRDEAIPFWNERSSDSADAERMIAYVVGKLDEVENAYAEAVAAVEAIEVAIRDHEQAYAGWARFFLVTSSNGLIHRSMGCSTCNKGRSLTTFALLPSFSGRPVDGLVDLFGPALCSVCFPSAPTDWTDAVRIPARIAETLLTLGEEQFRSELATYKAKQAAKAAKKAAQS